ncbi:MAG: PAS domain S-box protein, partial [Pseudoalteromonas sp.]
MVVFFALVMPISQVFAVDTLGHIIDEQIFAQHSAVMLVVEPQTGEIVFANKAAAKFYGYSISQLQVMQIQQINIFTEQQVAQERQAALSKGQNYFVFKHRLASGKTRTVSVYSAPFKLNNRRLLFSIIYDISSQRSLEKELWHYQENLEELVASQTEEIENKRADQFSLSLISIALLLIMLVILAILAARLRAAKKSAQEDSATLKAIFNGIDDLLIFTNTEHTILAANTMAVQKLTTGNGLKGKNIYSYMEALPQNTTIDSECQFNGAEQAFWGEVRITAVTDESKKQVGEIYLIRDITEKLETRQQQRLASTVFSTTNEGILVCNSDNKIQAINAAFTHITGYQERDVLGETPAILNSGRHKSSFFTALYAQLSKTGHWEGEIWNRYKDGRIYPCWLNVSVVFDEEKQIEVYVALFNDISLRKENEQ